MHENYTGWLLLATILVSFFFNLWGTPLFDLDEGAFSEATREMFLRGDFLSTYLNGEPRYDKPILIYWLQAASVAVLGINELAFRLPSALAASAWILMVYYFVSHIADRRRALAAAIITATSLAISVIGKAATADALLNFCITSAMLMYFLYYQQRKLKHLYFCFLFIGLGFLTKGPVAIMIPLVVSLLFCVIDGKFKFWLRSVFNVRGIIIFLIVALPWYMASYFHDGGQFIRGFLFEHNLDRFDRAMESHSGGYLYYVPVVLFGVLPYTSLLFVVLRRAPALWRDELGRYLLLWFGFVFVFFSFSGTKLPHYLIYGLTAMTILMALELDSVRNRWLAFLPALLFLAVLLGLPEILDAVRTHTQHRDIQDMLANSVKDIGASYRWIVAGGLLASIWLLMRSRRRLAEHLLACGMITVIVVSAGLLPAVAALQQQPVKEAALWAKRHGIRVIQWHVRVPSFNVYSQTISPPPPPHTGDYVLTTRSRLDDLPPATTLFSKNGLVLVRLDAVPD